MGIVVVKDAQLAKPLRNMMVNTGGVAGPADCALKLWALKLWLCVCNAIATMRESWRVV